jgi:hypothetical protein
MVPLALRLNTKYYILSTKNAGYKTSVILFLHLRFFLSFIFLVNRLRQFLILCFSRLLIFRAKASHRFTSLPHFAFTQFF